MGVARTKNADNPNRSWSDFGIVIPGSQWSDGIHWLGGPSAQPDCALIAAARNALPALIAAARERDEADSRASHHEAAENALMERVAYLESLLNDVPVPTTEEKRQKVRDLIAETVEEWNTEGGEFRAYDLADRLQKRLADHGWWTIWGADVAKALDQADNERDEARAEVERLREPRCAWCGEPLLPGEHLVIRHGGGTPLHIGCAEDSHK